MPVIGRLDKQVEDVLISPVSKRRDEKQTPHENEGESSAITEQSPSASIQTPTTDESSAKADELPIHLL